MRVGRQHIYPSIPLAHTCDVHPIFLLTVDPVSQMVDKLCASTDLLEDRRGVWLRNCLDYGLSTHLLMM